MCERVETLRFSSSQYNIVFVEMASLAVHCGISYRQGCRPKIVSSVIRNNNNCNIKRYLVIHRPATGCGSKRHFVCNKTLQQDKMRKLFVGKLSRRTRQRDIEELFERYGRMTRCDVKYG